MTQRDQRKSCHFDLRFEASKRLCRTHAARVGEDFSSGEIISSRAEARSLETTSSTVSIARTPIRVAAIRD